MAHSKVGLMYYSVDTDRYQDPKIKRLKRRFKAAGVGVYDYVLSEIYRVKGCYLAWNTDSCFDVAEYFEMEEQEVNEIIQFCCEVGLFDGRIFLKNNRLTSHAIQKRFLEWSKKAKRSNVEIPEECAILPEESIILPEESHILPEKNGKIPHEVKGSKVKEVKNRAKALVGSAEPGEESQRELEEKYESLTESLSGKDYKEIWTSIKTFITENKPCFINPFVDLWNVFADRLKLAKVQVVTEPRKKKFAIRIREEPFDFIKILEGIKKSALLKGETGTGWKATFDWVIENEKNYLKIIEGQYNG